MTAKQRFGLFLLITTGFAMLELDPTKSLNETLFSAGMFSIALYGVYLFLSD